MKNFFIGLTSAILGSLTTAISMSAFDEGAVEAEVVDAELNVLHQCRE